MQGEDSTPTRAPDVSPARGRPRDPQLESRVFDAAIAVYAAGGWRDFTFEAVARTAAVGKSGLYRRWGTRGELLCETLEARWYRVRGIDTGSIAGDLMALAAMIFDSGVGPYGDVLLHYRSDLHLYDEVREATRPYARELVAEPRAIVRRAVARGELPADTRPALIIDVIVGAVINRLSATPVRLRPIMLAQRDRFLRDLVGLVVRKAVAQPETP